MLSEISENSEPKKITVGEEFVVWAEQYWNLKRNYSASTEENSESCPYEYIKNIFIDKIDTIIKNRL